MQKLKWTKEEDDILREKYALYGSNIPELGRSRESIRTRAGFLGLTTSKVLWTAEEIDLLKKYWPKYGTKIPGLNKTVSSISSKAHKLGLTMDRWSEKDIKILKERYYTYGTHIPELSQYSVSAISHKAARLGLKNSRFDTKDHKGKTYSSVSKKCAAYDISISLYQKRKKDGCKEKEALTMPKKKQNQPAWSEQEISILREKYPTCGTDIPELQNRTRRSIQKKAIELKIKMDHTRYDHLGNRYETYNQMCQHYGLTKDVVNKRIEREGWSLEKALTTPLKGEKWTADEIKLLKKEFPKYGVKIPGLSHRTYGTIRKYARKYHLYYDDPHKRIIGEWLPNKCGLKIKYVGKNKGRSYHFEFEDGSTKVSTYYNPYKIAHPTLSLSGGRKNGHFLSFTTRYTGTVINDDAVYYECNCKICGCKNVMTPQQMMEHAKQHKIGCK